MPILKLTPQQKCKLAPILIIGGIVLIIGTIAFLLYLWYFPPYPEQVRIPDWLIWLAFILVVIGLISIVEGYIWLSYCHKQKPQKTTKKTSKPKKIKTIILLLTILTLTSIIWMPLMVLAGTGKIEKFDYYVKALEYLWKGFQTYVNAIIDLFKIAISS